MVPQNHEDPSVLPKMVLKHPSVTLSRGSLTLGQKDLDLFVFPSLPSYSSYLLSAYGVSGSVLARGIKCRTRQARFQLPWRFHFGDGI